MTKEHRQFRDTVNTIVDMGWGRDFESDEEAQKDLLNDLPKLTAHALIELLGRLNRLAAAVGPREVRSHEEFQKIDAPLKGLSVGDVVYAFNEDDDELDEDRVAVVDDGIGYLVYIGYRGPALDPIPAATHGKTKAEAVRKWREGITRSLKWCQKLQDRIPSLQALLEEGSE